MATKYLDKDGLQYFWGALKSYVAGLLGSKADDSGVVHIAGAETVTGTKTFTSAPVVKAGSGKYIAHRNTSLTRGTAPGSSAFYGYKLQDSAGTDLGALRTAYYQSGNTSTHVMSWSALSSSTNGILVGFDSSDKKLVVPYASGDCNLGSASSLWKEVFASAGTINTSDERLKETVGTVPDEVLDAWGDVSWLQFQFRDAVEQKGKEGARIHSGLIAQRIDEAFRARGLDASRYGLFCHDSWEGADEEVDEDGAVVVPARDAGDLYSLRYVEALAMEAAFQRRRADRLEARIAALEALLK